MTRTVLSFGTAAAAIFIAWSTPSEADCRLSACFNGPSPVSIQPVIIPPIAGQQIETASTPISLPVAPADANSDNSDDAAPVVGGTVPGGLAKIGDLDGGVGDWLAISPHQGFDKLPPDDLTVIAGLHAVHHAKPVPQKAEVEVSQFIAMEVPVVVLHGGVPGIDPMTSGDGNRSLWFITH